MAQWTSKSAILRDLSVAQGKVPVAIERTVTAGDKPPSLDITEETEEEFYKHCSADANVSNSPDLGLIQKMLNMVRDFNECSDGDDYTGKAVVITKIKAPSPEFMPIDKHTSTPKTLSPIKEMKVKPKKRQRNIAVESILQGNADNKPNEVVLRKPNYFINNNVEVKFDPTEKPEIYDQVSKNDCISVTPTVAEKVNGWFETQINSPFPKRTSKVTLDACNMVYKKKEKLKSCEKSPKDYVNNLEGSITSSPSCSEYKPSSLADEYYLKFNKHSKFKESIKEDIWKKAERKMKEIEVERKSKPVEVSSTTQTLDWKPRQKKNQSTNAFTARIVAEAKINRGLDLVSLSEHRHSLPGECIVCKVMLKKSDIPNIEKTEGKDDAVDNTDNANTINEELENIQMENNEINDDTTREPEILQVADLMDMELAKFVENVNFDKKFTEHLEMPESL